MQRIALVKTDDAAPYLPLLDRADAAPWLIAEISEHSDRLFANRSADAVVAQLGPSVFRACNEKGERL